MTTALPATDVLRWLGRWWRRAVVGGPTTETVTTYLLGADHPDVDTGRHRFAPKTLEVRHLNGQFVQAVVTGISVDNPGVTISRRYSRRDKDTPTWLAEYMVDRDVQE